MADGDPELDPDLPIDPVDEPDSDPEDAEQPDDTEEDADEPADEEPDEPDQQHTGGEAARPSRRDARIASLTRASQEKDRQLAETNRRLDALLQQRVQPQLPQGENPEQRAQRLALLSPEERLTETLREDREAHRRDMQVLAFNLQDGNDRAAFQAKATVDSLYQKWAPKVEAELAELRSKGQNVEREKLMDYLIGKHARESRQQQSKVQRKQAATRVARATTRPGNSGSDVQATRRQQGNSLERRLENVEI